MRRFDEISSMRSVSFQIAGPPLSLKIRLLKADYIYDYQAETIHPILRTFLALIPQSMMVHWELESIYR